MAVRASNVCLRTSPSARDRYDCAAGSSRLAGSLNGGRAVSRRGHLRWFNVAECFGSVIALAPSPIRSFAGGDESLASLDVTSEITKLAMPPPM